MGRRPGQVGGLDAPYDSFSAWYTAIQEAVDSGRRISLNSMTITGKQAAMELERRGEVKIVEDREKLVVEKANNFWRRVLTAGSSTG